MINRKFVMIVLFTIAIVSFMFAVISVILVSVLSGFGTDYSNPDDYTTETITIGLIHATDETIYIETEPEGRDFYISKSNYDVAIGNHILESLNTGDRVDIVYGPKGFGDSWDRPIVMIEKSGTVFLDYDTGFAQWVSDTTPSIVPMLPALLIPFVIFIGSLAGIIILRRQKNT